MKSNKKAEQTAAQITLGLILDGEKRMQAQSGTNEYWKTLESLNAELRLFIQLSHNLADITALELLEVCRMVGSYRPMPLNSFFICCAKALEGVKAAEAIK